MSFVKDKHGILMPKSSFESIRQNAETNFYQREDNTTLIFTTENGKPMIRSEITECIAIYQREFGVKPRTVIIPETLESHIAEFEKEFGLKVKTGAARHNQITLTQLGYEDENKTRSILEEPLEKPRILLR